MNSLKSVSTELCELIKELTKENAIPVIKKYINDVNKSVLLNSVQFPDGLTWFGVSEALTSDHTKGKIVVLDFFTYCCMNCIHILPHLKKIEEKYKNDDGFVVIGVHSPKFNNEKDNFGLQNAIVKLNITHPVVNDTENILWNDLDISCWPTLLILDPTGRPIFTLIGEGHEKELDIFIESALEYYEKDLHKTALPLCQTMQPVGYRFLSYPGMVTTSPNKKLLAISDSGHHRILIIKPTGDVEEIIGGPSAGKSDGNFKNARFRDPQGLAFHGDNELYVADCGNHLIRLINLKSQNVVTVVGTGQQGSDLEGGKNGLKQEISSPWGLCLVPAPSQDIPQIQNAPTVKISTPLIGGAPGPPPPPPPPLATTPSPTLKKSSTPDVLLIAMSGSHQIWAYFIEDTYWWKAKFYEKGKCVAIVGAGDEKNRNNRYPLLAGLAQPSGLTYCPEHDAVFIADSESSSIRKLDLLTGAVTAVVGGHLSPDNLFSYGDVDGEGTTAKLQHPLDVTWDQITKSLLIADSFNHKLKTVNVKTLKCTSCPIDVRFNEPGGISTDDQFIYVTDTNSHSLLKIQRDSWTVSEIELKQSATRSFKSKIRVVWETTVPIRPTTGSNVVLNIDLKDTTASGKWRVAPEESNSIIITQNSGVIEAGQTEIRFFTKTQDEAIFEVDIAVCRNEACHLRYFRLLVHPIASESAETTSAMSFNPSIDNL